MSYSYCPNCGKPVGTGVNYCPNCGYCVADAEVLPENTEVCLNAGNAEIVELPNERSGYSLILASLGTCTKVSARALFRDLLGYSLSDAIQITNAVPTELACSLTFRQAVDLARVFTEYGMQIAAYNADGYVDLSPYAGTSAFRSESSLLETVLATIATVTVANRVKTFLKWMRPAPQQHLFIPRYRYKAPPKYEPVIRKRKPVPEPAKAVPADRRPAEHRERRAPQPKANREEGNERKRNAGNSGRGPGRR